MARASTRPGCQAWHRGGSCGPRPGELSAVRSPRICGRRTGARSGPVHRVRLLARSRRGARQAARSDFRAGARVDVRGVVAAFAEAKARHPSEGVGSFSARARRGDARLHTRGIRVGASPVARARRRGNRVFLGNGLEHRRRRGRSGGSSTEALRHLSRSQGPGSRRERSLGGGRVGMALEARGEPPDTRVRRTRSSRSAPRSPLTRTPSRGFAWRRGFGS